LFQEDLRAGGARDYRLFRFLLENIIMSDTAEKVWPTGARVFFAIALFAHFLAFALSPWLG